MQLDCLQLEVQRGVLRQLELLLLVDLRLGLDHVLGQLPVLRIAGVDQVVVPVLELNFRVHALQLAFCALEVVALEHLAPLADSLLDAVAGVFLLRLVDYLLEVGVLVV